MKITFLGATGTVTGSRYHIVTPKTELLIDCGLYMGIKQLRLRNWSPLPINASRLNAVLLTHAHLDHSGYLPKFFHEGFEGKIYATQGTKALCDIILPDSGYLQEEAAYHANLHHYSKHHPAKPLYTQQDAVNALKFFDCVHFHEPLTINDVTVRWIPAGHIIGAAMIALEHRGQTTLFTGDIGRPNDLLMYPPESIQGLDHLIIESTYGNRRHQDENIADILESIIKKIVKQQSVLLIPAFAVGRAQALLHVLAQLRSANRIPTLPMFLDSPMAIDATGIYLRFHKEHRLTNAQCQAMGHLVKLTRTRDESKTINAVKGCKIIISASGMAEGGRILHHIKHYAGHANNTILFTGFQAPGTRGEAMINGAKHIKLLGETIAIQANVIYMESLSAHSDYQEMIDWLGSLKRPPAQVFITHGEPAASDGLRFQIKEQLGWQCIIPEYRQSFTL